MALNVGDIQPIVSGVGTIDAKLTALNEKAASAVTDVQATQAVNQLSQSIDGLGNGVDLIAQKQEAISTEANNMGAFWQEKVAEFINNQTNLLQATRDVETGVMYVQDSVDNGIENDNLNVELANMKPEIAVNAGTAQPGDLGASVNMPTLVANGYSLLFNALTTMTASLLDALAPLSQIAMLNNEALTVADQEHQLNQQKAASEEAKGGPNVLSQYLTQLAGPLNSIASGLMLMSLSVVALSLIPGLAANAFVGVVAFAGLMIMTFAALYEIVDVWNMYGGTFDPAAEGQPGSIMFIVKSFAITVGLMLGTFLLTMITINILKANIDLIFGGLIVTAGIMFGSMWLLNLLAKQNEGEFKENAAFPSLIKDFAMLVGIVTGVMLICAFAWPYILQGSLVAVAILGLAALMLWGLSTLMKETMEKLNADQLNAFKNILITVTVLIGVIAILAIVLGFIPQPVLIQGMIAVGLIILLIDSMFLALGHLMNKLQDVPAEQLNTLMGILITLTVLVAIMGGLVYILGSMPLADLVQGMVAVALLIAIPIIAMELLSNIDIDEKVFITLIEIGIMVLLIGVVAAIVATVFSMVPGGANAVLISSISILITAAAFVALAYAAPMLATAATTLMSPGPFFGMPNFVGALIGLGLVSVLAIAIAGVALVITYIFLAVPGGPQAVMQSAIGLFFTALAFAVIAPMSVLLAAMFIPLFFCVALSIGSLGLLVVFARAIAWAATELSTFTVDPAMLDPAKEAMITFGKMVQDLTPIVRQLAIIMIPFTLFMYVVARTTLVSVVSLAMFDFALWLIAALKVPTDQFKETINGMKDCLITMQGMTDALRNYVGLPIWRWWGVLWDLDYMAAAARRLSRIGAAGDASNIEALANSLEKLSNTANGLSEVAQAMRDVASAASELNNIRDINIAHSVQTLAGVNVNGLLSLKELIAPPTKKEDPAMKQMQKSLDSIENVLERLLGALSQGNAIAEDTNSHMYRSANNSSAAVATS